MSSLPPALRAALRCPACAAALVGDAPAFSCSACHASYPGTPDGRPDLRLRAPRRLRHEVTIGEDITPPPGLDFAPLARNPAPAVGFSGMATPIHLSTEILSWFPAAREPGEAALDLGCGRGWHREAVERAGFSWVGMDFANKRAPLLADAHALPFADQSFGFVVSVAVLEHLRHPAVALAEIARVLRPGGRFIATMAFLEPFHKDSYFNISHLGALSLLRHAGLTPLAVAPGRNGLYSLARMGLFAGLPRALAHGLAAPLDWLSRLWWKAGRSRWPRLTDDWRRLILSGDMTVVADRPR